MREGDYNPAYIYPPVIEDCERHRQANRIFKGDNIQATYDFHKCQCCARSIGQDQVQTPFCYDPAKELMFLGPGVPLLFIFSRMATVLLLMFTLVFTIYGLISNIRGDTCQQSIDCPISFFVRMSLANKIFDSSSINIQNYLLVVFIFLYAPFLQLFIYLIRKTDQRADQLINSPSDYALLISQLPEGWTVQDVLQMIDQQRYNLDEDQKAETDNLSIKDMIFSFKLKKYLELLEEDQQQFLKAKKEDPDCNYQRMKIDMPSKVSSFVIVIFNRQASKNVFRQPRNCYSSIKNFLCNCTLCLIYSQFQINSQPVVVERAPEPDDILWKNADKKRSSIIRNKIISYVISIGILVLGGYIQYELEVQKNRLDNELLANIYTVISSLSLTVFNAIISMFLVFMTAKEGDTTQTNMNSSLLVKVSLFEFFNAGIFNTFARILAGSIDNFDLAGDQAYQIFLFIFINAIVPTSVNILLVLTQFPTGLQRWLFRKGCLKYNQQQANQLFQRPQIQFPIKYAYIINTIWLACFYGPFAPVVIPISAVGLVYFHLAEQYLFRNKYSVPFMLSKDLIDTAVSILRYTGIITLAGSFIVTIFISYQLKAEFTAVEAIPFILGLILSGAIIFMPSTRINQSLFRIKDKQKTPPVYDQACKEFTVTYMETHPLSSHARKMKRSEVLVKNFFQMVELKSAWHQSPVKYSNSMNWRDIDSSRGNALLRTASLGT